MLSRNVIDDGVAYIKGCQMPDGGFSYFKGQGYSAFARSAAAIVGLYSAGVYTGKEVDRGLRYVNQYLPVRQFAARMLIPCAFFQLFDAIQVTATGALRGAGNTRTAMIVHIVCYWFFGLPIGYFLCFRAGWGAIGIWIGLSSAIVVIGCILGWAWNTKQRTFSAAGT